MTEFLRHCASLLDEGVEARKVLALMKERYTTAQCMKVKTCLVRKKCRLCPSYLAAVERELKRLKHDPALAERVRVAALEFRVERADSQVIEVLRTLPPTHPQNVRDLCIDKSEVKACRRAASMARLKKNRKVLTVDGEGLLQQARAGVEDATTAIDLAMCLMLLTGRRTCEMLGGRASFSPVADAPFAACFTGQAKQKNISLTYTVPLLDTYDRIMAGFSRLRAMQNGAVLTPLQTTRRYQSALSRKISNGQMSQIGRAHALRGVYACMAFVLFDWGGASQAYVTMCILGHASLTESLVYTTCGLGAGFERLRGCLGKGSLSERDCFNSPDVQDRE